VIGGLPGQDVAIVIAQAKFAWTWPSKTDFETGIEFSDCGATELHKPSNKLWRILPKAAVYLHVTRIPALRHGGRNKAAGGGLGPTSVPRGQENLGPIRASS